MTQQLKPFLALFLLVQLFQLGCGGSSLPKGDTGTVRGKVTYNGAPVPAGCSVTFVRDKDGLIATGAVSSSGEYSLRMRDGAKIVVGTYRVSVSPPTVAESLTPDEIMKRGSEGTLPEPATIKEVPMKYRSPEESPLTFDVKTGSNTFDIDMKE